jgi:D-alanine-D-alanine ligase
VRVGILEAVRAHELSRPGAEGRARGVDHLSHSLQRHEKTAAAVRECLRRAGQETVTVPVDGALLSRLQKEKPDLVFNTYFGPATRQDQAHVASLMEYARIPFTGGGAACHFIGLSKPLSKQVLASSGLPTPRFFAADGGADADRAAGAAGMRFPMIVKAPAEGEGIGLDARSVVSSRAELEAAVGRIVSAWGEPALVEEFMPGREFTVGVLAGAPASVLPIMEILLDKGAIYSYDAKAGDTVAHACPAALPAREAAVMGSLAVRAGRVIGCRDFWRVDFRLDARGAPQVLEVNTLPGLQPGYSDIVGMAESAGMSYEEIVGSIIDSAARRLRRVE